MNEILFNNEIKVSVSQSPENPQDGDTVVFSATSYISSVNNAESAGYNFTYIWMVSYDGGISYKKIGINNSTLIIENINSQQFQNNLYKVKIILEDLEDFLLTESGDKILNQIGEILVFNNNTTGLSIQSDPINTVNDNTIASSVNNSVDNSNTKLDFINLSAVINEAAVFDDTINENTTANVLSSQASLSITDSSQTINGEISLSPTLPDTPQPDIQVPSSTLSIQSASCWKSIEKTYNPGGTSQVQADIKWTACVKNDRHFPGWWGWGNCADSNPDEPSTTDFTSELECVAIKNGCSDTFDTLYCETVPENEIAVEIHRIISRNQLGQKETFCCYQMVNVCDHKEPIKKCEETELKRNVSPCMDGDTNHCEQEPYQPEDMPKYFIANQCTSMWSQQAPDNAERRADKYAYCTSKCDGTHKDTAVSLQGMVNVGSDLLAVSVVGGVGGSAGAALGVIILVGNPIGMAITGAMITAGLVGALFGSIGAVYIFPSSNVAAQNLVEYKGKILTRCDGDGSYLPQFDPYLFTIYGTQLRAPIFKECTKYVCMKKWMCKDDGLNKGKTLTYSRVAKGAGSSITVGDTTNASAIPVGQEFTSGGKIYTKIDNNTAYIRWDQLSNRASYTLSGQVFVKGSANEPDGMDNAFVAVSIDGGMTCRATFSTDRILDLPGTPYTELDLNAVPISYTCTNGGRLEVEFIPNTCTWRVVSKCCPNGQQCNCKVTNQDALKKDKRYSHGTFKDFDIDARGKTGSGVELYEIDRSKPLDFITSQINSSSGAPQCASSCKGKHCGVREYWDLDDTAKTEEVACNETYYIPYMQTLGPSSLENDKTYASSGCDMTYTYSPMPQRKIIWYKLVKKYRYLQNSDLGSSQEEILRQTWNTAINKVKSNGEKYAKKYVFIYHQKPIDIVAWASGYTSTSFGNASNLIKKPKPEKDNNNKDVVRIKPVPYWNSFIQEICNFKQLDFNKVKKYIAPVGTFGNQAIYYHYEFEFQEVMDLSNTEPSPCDKCDPVFTINDAKTMTPYPCNDVGETFCGELHPGNCLKSGSNQNTPIRIITISCSLPPTDKQLDDIAQNGDKPINERKTFLDLGLAKTAARNRLGGSPGMICSDPQSNIEY